jgi:excisionase family DNA binding protein
MLPATPISISIKESGAVLGVSANTVRRLVAAGRLPSIRIGRRRLVPVEALKEMVRLTTK